MRICRSVLPVLALSTVAIAAPPDTAGPPAFVSYPILVRVGEPGSEHGHFVMGPGESLVPGPLAPSLGASPYNPAAKTGGSGGGAGTEINVSNAPDSYQGETSAAASTTHLVAGSNSIYPGNCSATAAPGAFGDCAPRAYSSPDNGANWSRTALSRVWNGTAFGIGFDPAVDTDKSGTFYFSYGVAPLSGSYPNAIVMMKSTDGVNWTKTTPVTFNKSRAFDDKYYLAIDRSNSNFANRIYVTWDRNQANNQILYVASSGDFGASWSAPIKVNDGTSSHERVIGAYPAVDQNNGTVYVSWHDYAKNIIFVDKSANGGVNWGKDVAIATTHAGFGSDIGCVGGRSQGPAHALKVGPSGTLYLVYADPVANRGFDVLFTKSTDAGATWSAPVSLNDDATSHDQFHPTLSVQAGTQGDRVTVTFYDRRDDPANCYAHVYSTQSTDGGTTWSANVRQTSVASDFDGNANGPGDYSSSIPSGGAVYPFFADHRADFEVYTVNVQ